MVIKQRRPDPTPEEIREACLLIQSEWSDVERERRTAPAHRRVPAGFHGAETGGVKIGR